LQRQRIAPALGRPGVAGVDHHAEGQLFHVEHAGHRAGRAVVELVERGADHRRAGRHREHHAGQALVEAELGAAVHLHGRVEPLLRLAQVTELRGILERRLFGHGLFRGRIGQLAVAE
jgi:hypothetical protein